MCFRSGFGFSLANYMAHFTTQFKSKKKMPQSHLLVFAFLNFLVEFSIWLSFFSNLSRIIFLEKKRVDATLWNNNIVILRICSRMKILLRFWLTVLWIFNQLVLLSSSLIFWTCNWWDLLFQTIRQKECHLFNLCGFLCY